MVNKLRIRSAGLICEELHLHEYVVWGFGFWVLGFFFCKAPDEFRAKNGERGKHYTCLASYHLTSLNEHASVSI